MALPRKDGERDMGNTDIFPTKKVESGKERDEEKGWIPLTSLSSLLPPHTGHCKYQPLYFAQGISEPQ